MRAEPPLIMHVVYRFDVGGLENGLVNLINRLPAAGFRHAVVALTECEPSFCRRVERDDVEFISVRKPPGHGWRAYHRLWRIFRRARPAIVHTRNLAALEMQVPAMLAGVPIRVHGEHGRDIADPGGTSPKHRFLRRAFSPFVTHYVALSDELYRYLIDFVGIDARHVSRIRNGVDESRFTPSARGRADGERSSVVVGTVGRLERVKAQHTLVEAAAKLVAEGAVPRAGIRVWLVGEGPVRGELERLVAARGLEDVVELLGACDDVAERMRGFDVFVLPSLAEGISNTVLEAMASGLPVVATSVGGNVELVEDGRTGTLVPSGDVAALAAAIGCYVESPRLRADHGARGRARVEAELSLARMVDAYRELYESALGRRGLVAPRTA